MDFPFQGGVALGIGERRNLEIHMETGAGRLALLCFHMVAAERNRVIQVTELVREILRRDPLLRIIAVIVVHIHDADIGLLKIGYRSVVSFILRADVIPGHGSAEFFFVGDQLPVGVQAVFSIPDIV